jgi:hypothetical protein
MTHLIALVDSAMGTTLTNFAGLTALVGQKIFFMEAPPGSSLPYVTYQKITGGWTWESQRDNADTMYQVMAWSTSKAEAYRILEQVYLALNRQSLVLPGWDNYSLLGRKWISLIRWDQGNQYYGEGQEFEIRADRSP